MLLVYLTAAWIAGIVAASQTPLPWALWAWWLVLPAGSLLILWRDAFLRQLCACLLVFVLAALRYTAALPSFNEHALASLNDHGPVALVGAVVDPPEIRDQIVQARLAVTSARVGNEWREVNGLALIQAPRETDIRYGDRLRIFAEPATPFETPDFSYKDYLARRGIHSVIRVYGGVTVVARDQGDPVHAAIYALRDRALTALHAVFPEPAGSLLAGILLGDEAGIPRDLDQAFSDTNTAHIIAISGFNISILAGILLGLARRLSKSRILTTLFVIVALVVYTLLVGAGDSVVRAAIMGILSVLALYFRRQNDALNALAFAAFFMTAQNPLVLWDLSFQLSFLATLGLILYVEPLSRAFQYGAAHFLGGARAQQLVALLADAFIVTLAAQITTTPLIVSVFHRLSLVGLLANLLVLPAQPAVMVLGGLATLTAMVIQPLGQVIAWIAWAFLEWTILVVEWAAQLPFAVFDVPGVDTWGLGLYYALLFGATLVDWSALRRPAAQPVPPASASVPTAPATPNTASTRIPLAYALGVGGLLVVAILLGNLALTAPDGKVHIEFLDAGDAATLVRTPSGRRVLIDGGSSPSNLLSALGKRMPFWERSLDLVVLTSPDDDHLGGLVPVLERYSIQQIVQVNAPAKPSAAYLKWRDLVASKRVPSVGTPSGLKIVIEPGVELEILAPAERSTSDAAAVRVRAGTLSLLLADSLTEEEQKLLLETEPDLASVVLAPPRKLTPRFYEAVSPQFAVLFVGTGTRAQPPEELTSGLSDAAILRTDERGTIELIVDAAGVRVRTER